MHIIYRFVKSLYNMHQCLRCILGHLQWSQSLYITLANPRLAVIELHTKMQLFSLSVFRYNWSWLQRFWPRLNQFNPNWANPPIYHDIYFLQNQDNTIQLNTQGVDSFVLWVSTGSNLGNNKRQISTEVNYSPYRFKVTNYFTKIKIPKTQTITWTLGLVAALNTTVPSVVLQLRHGGLSEIVFIGKCHSIS